MEKTKSGHWYRECWRWDTLGFQLHLIWRMWYGACYVDIGRWERGLGKVTALIPGCSCIYCYSSCNDPFWLPWSSNSDVYNFRPKSSSGIPPWLCSITEPQKALSWAVSFLQRPWIYQYFIWLFLIKLFLSIFFLTVTQVLAVWAGRQSWTPPSYA